MVTTITEESDFYFWIVEYLHKLGPVKMYPAALADAADLALELIAELQHEEEALQELVPEAQLCPCWGDNRNQALGVVFHLARDVDQQRPYSEAVIHFLAKCYCPPASTMFEAAARVGFLVAGLDRTNYFQEYRGRCRGEDTLHLVTTKQGHKALGVRVDMEYPLLHKSYIPSRKPISPEPVSPKRTPASKPSRPALRAISTE